MASGPNHPGARRPRPAEPDSAEARVQKARERAAHYKTGESRQGAQAVNQEAEQPERSMEEWRDIVSRRIEDAMQQGAFDNLPGRGKPLDLRRDPFVPEDQQMAFRLLHNNDLVPAWIGDRKEVLQTIDALRADIRRVALQLRTEWDAHQATETSKNRNAKNRQVWERYVSRWEADIAQLNHRILSLNLKQPAAHLEVFKVLLDEELTKIGATRTHFLPG